MKQPAIVVLMPALWFLGMPVSSPARAARPLFPPLRHGLKAVFGRNGNDHGGDLEGQGKQLLQAFHDLGVDLTRIEFKWAIIESTRGTYDWSEPDRLINFLHAGGVEPMLMLYCAPKWAMRGSPADEQLFIARGERNLHTVVWPRREFLPDFERFCQTAARRYAGKARLFEFWNEPDGMAGPIVLHDKTGRAVDVRYGGDAAEYTRWLKVMYRAVKRGNPHARVAAGSLCRHDLKFIEAIYAAGGGPFCDGISLHPYDDAGVNLEWIEQVHDVMTRYGDWTKPIWLTEFGWTHGGQYNEATESFGPAADKVARLISATFPTIVQLPYVTHSFFFTLNDWRTGEGGIDPPGIHAFGLVDLGSRRRPGFEAFKQVVANTPNAPRQARAPTITIVPPRGPVDTCDAEFSLPVTILNPFPDPQRITLEVDAPDALFQPITQAVEAPAGTSTHVIRGRVSQSCRPAPARTVIRAHHLRPAETLITVPAPAADMLKPPTIDGDLSEWPPSRLRICPGDMQAGFAWDQERLYFACQLVDTSHQQPHRGRDLWKGDCVQLAFDPRRDAIRGSKYDLNDSEFALALAADGPVLWRYACPLDSYVGPLPADFLAARRAGNRTMYEAAIPWREIAVEAARKGQVIGIAVAGCDWTGARRTVYRFGDGIIGGKQPFCFGSIRLVSSPP